MEPIFETRQKYKRIYFDLPGMGKTKGENWIKGTDDYLKITMQFVERIIPNESFIIVGESYGGYLARGLIQKKQNLVDGVLFLAPSIWPGDGHRPEPVILVKDENLYSQLSPFEKEMFEYSATVINKKVFKRAKEEAMSGVMVADMSFLEKAGENRKLSFNVDILDNKFAKPTLFLLGRQDSAVGYRDAWEILENYPRATFAILDTAGHILQIEQETLFNALTNEWLDRIEYSLKK